LGNICKIWVNHWIKEVHIVYEMHMDASARAFIL